MFHQVKVLPEDADALRFLWWDAAPRQPPKEYKMLVDIFSATSSPCCANRALRQTADDNKGRYSPEVIMTIYRNFYVDDVLKSVPTTDQAIWLAEQLTKLLREGGFHLTKFTSNSRQVLEALPQDKRANPSINLDLNQLPRRARTWITLGCSFRYLSIQGRSHKQAAHQMWYSCNS
ncbi:uncharacterized protein [Montipora foliosa]|uniref:uncharacterized protein n=1 Tax=Montipora foliosa TaxID=591990 RepID=UPI0035F1D2BE